MYLTTHERFIRVIHTWCILHNICLGRGNQHNDVQSAFNMELLAGDMDNDDDDNDGNENNLHEMGWGNQIRGDQ
jgi:hypothetical protein